MYKLLVASTYCILLLALFFKLPTFVFFGTVSVVLILIYDVKNAIKNSEKIKKEYILAFSIIFLLAAIEKNNTILFETSMGLLGIYTAIVLFFK